MGFNIQLGLCDKYSFYNMQVTTLKWTYICSFLNDGSEPLRANVPKLRKIVEYYDIHHHIYTFQYIHLQLSQFSVII